MSGMRHKVRALPNPGAWPRQPIAGPRLRRPNFQAQPHLQLLSPWLSHFLFLGLLSLVRQIRGLD